jgi:hypothetical protein
VSAFKTARVGGSASLSLVHRTEQSAQRGGVRNRDAASIEGEQDDDPPTAGDPQGARTGLLLRLAARGCCTGGVDDPAPFMLISAAAALGAERVS